MDGEKSVVQDEKVLKAKSGYAMLLLGIIGMLLGVVDHCGMHGVWSDR